MEYFEQPVRLDGEIFRFIHTDNDFGGAVLDRGRAISCFESSEALRDFARRKKLTIAGVRDLLDLDRLSAWLDEPNEAPDCPALHASWNLFGDVARALGRTSEYLGYERRFESLHEELLWGCNPKSAWADKPYEPEFSRYDVARLAEVFDSGVEILRQGIRPMTAVASGA